MRRLLSSKAGGVPPLISAGLADPLTRVSAIVTRTLDELRELRPESVPWTNGLDAMIAISTSPRRHLFRPQLVLLGAHKRPSAQSETFAAGVELQHLFMLVHDDVMDKGTIRRGLPTVSVALNRGGLVKHEAVDQLATLIGDVLHAKSLALLLEGAQGNTASIMRIVDAACLAGAAQFDDVVGWPGLERQMRAGLSLSVLQQRHACGIAVEHGFVAPLVAGMLLGDPTVPPDAIAAVQRWGEQAGTCFLELEDVADVVMPAAQSGKDALQDIREGRLSQILFALRRVASNEEWDSVAALCGTDNYPISLFDRRATLDIIARHRISTRVLESSQAHLANAEAAVDAIGALGKDYEHLRLGLHTFCQGLRAEVDRLESIVKAKER